MRRLIVLHPEGVATAVVLTAGALVWASGRLVSVGLLRIADWCDRRLAAATDLEGED